MKITFNALKTRFLSSTSICRILCWFSMLQCIEGKGDGQEEEIGNFVSPKVGTFLCIMIMCKEIYAHMFF